MFLAIGFAFPVNVIIPKHDVFDSEVIISLFVKFL